MYSPSLVYVGFFVRVYIFLGPNPFPGWFLYKASCGNPSNQCDILNPLICPLQKYGGSPQSYVFVRSVIQIVKIFIWVVKR